MTGVPRLGGSVRVEPEEQLLQGGRLADEGADARRGQPSEQFPQLAGIHVTADRGAVDQRVVHARQVGEPDRLGIELGGDRGTGQVAQVREGAGLDDPAVADDRHVVAQGLDLGEGVARQQHRAAGAPFVLDAVAEGLGHERVEPGGRLVEQQQLGLGGEGGDERDLLPVPLGVGTHLLRGIELEALEELAAAASVEPAPQPAQQVDDLAPGEGRPQVHLARHVREPSVQPHSIDPGVAAEEPDGAAVGADQAEQDPDRGRLARPVRSEVAVHLASGDLQVEPVERTRSAEGLLQSGDRYRCGRSVHGTPRLVISASTLECAIAPSSARRSTPSPRPSAPSEWRRDR